MNLILFERKDYTCKKRVRLYGRTFIHAKEVFKAVRGEKLSVGLINGKTGTGQVTNLEDDFLEMEVNLDREPPPPLPVTLVIALPRPKMLGRILESATSMGVKEIYIINSWRVEKSYWLSPKLNEESIREHLIAGLEQAKDTLLPEIHLKRLFTPFVRKELPGLIKDNLPLVAHPLASEPFPDHPQGKVTLAIGPEGGFISKEIETFEAIGFQSVTLGERILRVETAVPALLSRLC